MNKVNCEVLEWFTTRVFLKDGFIDGLRANGLLATLETCPLEAKMSEDQVAAVQVYMGNKLVNLAIDIWTAARQLISTNTQSPWL